ncbi:BAG domain-containing protein Samui [Topomyia yanbarensis]|uniref:BAG domain-containing protein Samui n=1 Tax=Topomyia yanbarensis TaxID=2498891 RepID=UPI00273C7E8C|nr:BAG domain-containing protein Samui [Topomyia yanbarensis]
MSQQEQTQPTVRHIPIFVEGRSEPLVNKVPETQPSHNSSTSAMPEPPRMEMPSHNTSDFFKHGSIFDRARDFPVRTFPSSTFFNKNSSARESSPARQVPVFGESGIPTTTVPPSQQQQQPPTRGSSQPRQTPSPTSAAQQQQQYQQQQAQRFQQHQQEQQDAKQQSGVSQDQPDSQSKPPPPTANDPISKIQKIQRDVLAIFDQVERFQGGKDGKRDKAYIFLDEMLTQNLLKLDSIDAEDQPQIKSARKEAIKSINHCIVVLEAKAEAGSLAEAGSEQVSGSNEQVPNGTANRTGSAASLSHSSSNSSSQQQQQ